MSEHLIFIYGSLRRGCARSMAMRFPSAKFIGEAEARGSLYDLGEYPGLVLSESDSPVVGEVYEVDDETLKQLDEFEASSNYLRKQAAVSLGADKTECWTYEPDPAFYSFHTQISSGDWLEYSRLKQPNARLRNLED